VKVLLSGSSGLIGGALASALAGAGHEVVRLVRRPPGPSGAAGGAPGTGAGPAPPRAAGHVLWDPLRDLDERDLEGLDAVVHLAGAPIARFRWTQARKREIHDSRVVGTRKLCEALSRTASPPTVLVSASAVGWYGERGDERLTEESGKGQGFLSDLCGEWEAATAPAREHGVRVVNLRSGIVLAASGGILARQLPLFRLGLGARLGSGRQFVSWISLRDHVGAVLHLLGDRSISGPVNCTGPEPATNADLTDALAGVLGRRARLAVPATLISAVFGAEMARETVLASQRAFPARLAGSGYRFADPDLDGALREALSA
jgi:uncharacterized protein (TIGR01777 family)